MPASPLTLPAVPATLKSIGHYLKTANEHETRDPVITYWCRLSALQNGLKLDKKSKEALAVLLPLMDWLEKVNSYNVSVISQMTINLSGIYLILAAC